MRKKIVIGSMLVLTLLLLMPSIPAVQQKTIEDKAYSDFIEELNDFNSNDIGKLNEIEHQELFDLIVMILKLRLSHGLILSRISSRDYGNEVVPIFPLLYFRAGMILSSAGLIAFYWDGISDTLGWNWDCLVDIMIQYIANW